MLSTQTSNNSDLTRDYPFTIKITNRKIARVLLNLQKGVCLCDITKLFLHQIHFTILVTVLPII